MSKVRGRVFFNEGRSAGMKYETKLVATEAFKYGGDLLDKDV